MRIVIHPKGNRDGKLADVELQFDEGDLAGLKLTGIAVWADRRTGEPSSVTFPSRKYTPTGSNEERTYTMLRAQRDPRALDVLRGRILAEYKRTASMSVYARG